MKKIFTLLCVAFCAASLFANVVTGTCGDNLQWAYDTDTHALTITGSGDMYWSGERPWEQVAREITSVSLPDGLTSIGDYAFSSCSSLTSITIPESVTSIGNWAFSDCRSLTSVTIPNRVTSIGDCAFRNCSSLTSMVVEEGNTIYDSRDNCNAIIETATNTLLVGCQNTIIPNSVTSIGISSFIDCSSLTSITIPNSVVSIASFAFWKCTSLTSLTIPNSVTSIEDNAFGYCVFSKDNFINRSSLDAEANNYWGATIVDQIVDGLLIRNDTVIDYIGNMDTIVIPDGVVAIADDVFRYNSKIKSVTIPNSVTSIGKLAFDGCSALTSITIPESVTTIGNNAFEYCTNLTSIVWNPVSCSGFWTEETTYSIFYGCENVTSVAFGNKVAEIPRYLCRKMSKLDSVTIPESVKTIGDYAFYDCVALQNAILGNRVTTIGKYAFFKCTSLTSITIPNSVTSIGERAFRGCFFTKNNFINNSSLDEVANKYWGAEIADIEQDGLLICNDTVVGCRPMVTSAVIPNTITCIGNDAFNGCSSITSITIPNSVTSIGEWAFDGCYSLISITIPNSVMRIGTLAFQGTGIYNDDSNWENDGLYIDKCFIQARNTISGAYNIKENTRLIGGGAFMECSALTSLIIPYGVIGIGDCAFQNCSSLSSITIPNNVESIGKRAFWKCSSLTSVTIGNSVTSIGNSAFYGCSSLATVICKAIEVPELESNVFSRMPISEATLYVPAESLEDYKAAEQWKEFGTILPLDKTPNSVENIQTTFVNGKKLLRNNQLLILREGKTYSVMGQEM